MKNTKSTIKENISETDVLPEFIAGIPTAKHRSKERMALIRSYFILRSSRSERGFILQGKVNHRNSFRQETLQYCINKIETKEKSQPYKASTP
jgi:hypothetical protein